MIIIIQIKYIFLKRYKIFKLIIGDEVIYGITKERGTWTKKKITMYTNFAQSYDTNIVAFALSIK